MSKAKNIFKDIQKSFMSGVSFMLPAVVAGGIMLAISLSTGERTSTGVAVSEGIMTYINALGGAAFTMMIPILGGYISYSIAGKPGLVPGMVLGFLADNPIDIGGNDVQAGFLGAMLLGILSGYFVKWIKTWKVPKEIRTVMPIIIIPVVSVFVLGLFYVYIIAGPVSILMDLLTDFLRNLSGTNMILLAIGIGVFGQMDFGGPITKTVTMFTLALMSEGIYAPNGMYRTIVAVPPLGVLLATILFKNRWDKQEKDLAIAAGIMGFIGISEGVIPFMVKDIKRILPSTIGGCIVGSIIAAFGQVESYVPHGGFLVLPVVDQRIWYITGTLAGTLVTALLLGALKPKLEEKTKNIKKINSVEVEA